MHYFILKPSLLSKRILCNYHKRHRYSESLQMKIQFQTEWKPWGRLLSSLVAKAKVKHSELQTSCFLIKAITPDVKPQEEKN